MKPKRIQRKRTKGWKMPEGAVYVGRPTKWGNTYTVEKIGDTLYSVSRHVHGGVVYSVRFLSLAAAISDSIESYKTNLMTYVSDEDIAELRGKDLACWCPLDQPCHADVLLELANKEAAM